MEATRIRLAEGVHLTYLPARKFKTSLLSAQFVTPLRRETAGANALLAAVLRRVLAPRLTAAKGEALAATLCGWYAFAGAVLLFQHYFVGPVYTIYK